MRSSQLRLPCHSVEQWFPAGGLFGPTYIFSFYHKVKLQQNLYKKINKMKCWNYENKLCPSNFSINFKLLILPMKLWLNHNGGGLCLPACLFVCPSVESNWVEVYQWSRFCAEYYISVPLCRGPVMLQGYITITRASEEKQSTGVCSYFAVSIFFLLHAVLCLCDFALFCLLNEKVIYQHVANL